jgi:hypothetical protein
VPSNVKACDLQFVFGPGLNLYVAHTQSLLMNPGLMHKEVPRIQDVSLLGITHELCGGGDQLVHVHD